MARGKKKETLTPGDRLQAALVPESEQPYPVPGNWCWVYWGVCGDFQAGSAFKNEYQGLTEYKIPFYKVGSLKYSDSNGILYDTSNTVNEEVVNTDSIYLITSDGQYHKATDTDIGNNVTSAYLNLDFERKSVTNNVGINYYYPHNEMGCYSSIVSQSAVDVPENIYEYMAEKGGTVAQAYFTALGRERYSMYKTNNNPTELFKEFSTP